MLKFINHGCQKKLLKWRYKVANKNNYGSDLFEESSEEVNLLWQYVQSMSPDIVSHLSKPTSQEVFQVMERNIIGLLGNIPSEQFNVNITTSRENLGKLLASAMISGYFLRNAEQRMTFEKSLSSSNMLQCCLLDSNNGMLKHIYIPFHLALRFVII